eukprot:GSA25T00019109001.1
MDANAVEDGLVDGGTTTTRRRSTRASSSCTIDDVQTVDDDSCSDVEDEQTPKTEKTKRLSPTKVKRKSSQRSPTKQSSSSSSSSSSKNASSVVSSGSCLWRDKIQRDIKRIVYLALLSCQDRVLLADRKNSFEMVGFDFMVDDRLNVWLIECNSSPDLSYSTSTTKSGVKNVLTDLVSVIVDAERFPRNVAKGKQCMKLSKKHLESVDTGDWVLLYRREQKALQNMPSAEEVRAHLQIIGAPKTMHKSKKKTKSLATVVRNLVHGRKKKKPAVEVPVDEAEGEGGKGDEGATDTETSSREEIEIVAVLETAFRIAATKAVTGSDKPTVAAGSSPARKIMLQLETEDFQPPPSSSASTASGALDYSSS